MSHFASNEVVLLVRYTTMKMIRQLAILAVAAVCLAASTTAAVTPESAETLRAEKSLYGLASHIHGYANLEAEVLRDVQGFDITADFTSYGQKWEGAIRALRARYEQGMLPRGRIFSVFYPYQLEEAVLIFKAFYYAPTIQDLMRVIYWAHSRLNEYQFNYAFNMALMHHPATKFISLQPPYQVNPELFFNTDFMKQLYDYKVGLLYKPGSGVNTLVLPANYTNWYIAETLHHEYNLSYFMEDILLNTWYEKLHFRYPFWMSSTEFPDMGDETRGEIYYYAHNWIVNRYRMERLSHGLGDIDFIDIERTIRVGYFPYMTYLNGMHFPRRNDWSPVPFWMNRHVGRAVDFESRIADAADSGFIVTTDGKFESIRNRTGFNTLCNLVQGNADSINKNYYGSVDASSRHILGFSPKPQHHYQILPSALENYATSLRDPAFYRMYNRFMYNFKRYKANLGPYSPQELILDGVTITSANIVEGKVITYFEWINNRVEMFRYSNYEHQTEISARQYRLNYKPFDYNIIVNSNEAVKASIRIFLGPKKNVFETEISDIYQYFYEIDFFSQDLTQGSNVINRKSTEAPWIAPTNCSRDQSSESVIGVDQQRAFNRCRFGFPAHLMMPIGSAQGLPVQFLVYVSKFDQDTEPSADIFMQERDNKPLGFPLDRPINNFTMPNMRLFETMIFHKNDASSINLTTQ